MPLGTAVTIQNLVSTSPLLNFAQHLTELLLSQLEISSHSEASFSVLSNPEFLAEGTAVHDLLHPDRVIIGWPPASTPSTISSVQPPAVTTLIKLYTPYIPRRKIITMDSWSSELGKLASNAFLAQQITSMNSIASICEASQQPCNIRDVSRVVSTDSRLGGAIEAGFGVGGPCLEKDLLYLVYLAYSLDLKDVAAYWKAVIDTNKAHQARVADRIVQDVFWRITPSVTDSALWQSKITVLGLGFKKYTSDTRGSIVISMIKSFVA